jgi:hypothetical protein
VNPLPVGWRLWVQIAGGIVAGGVVLDLVHRFLGL